MGKIGDLTTHQQKPDYLWIGCSDSRVPANEIVGLKPGEIFVHRNIANIVVQSDMNCLSTIQFAVDHLKVKHILICGHYECGGVKASLEKEENLGMVSNWTRPIFDTYYRYHKELKDLPRDRMLKKLCELNVMEQVRNVCQTTVLQDAWKKGQIVHVHGVIYDLHDGILLGLGIHIDSNASLKIYRDKIYNKQFMPSPQALIITDDEQKIEEEQLQILSKEFYFK